MVEPDRPDHIAPERALAHVATFTRLVEDPTRRLRWDRVTPDPRPLAIADLDGAPLFYDFDLRVGDAVVGHARAAATRQVGTPVMSVEIGKRRWDPHAAIRAATERAAVAQPGVAILGAQLVCYSYPKIAVRVQFAEGPDHATPAGELLFDAASHDPVSPREEPEHQFAARSFLDTHPLADELHRGFSEQEKALEDLSKAPGLGAPSGPGRIEPLPRYVWLSPLCRNVIGVSQYAQTTNYNCVPASAQMILDHYGLNYRQSEVATAMGTTTSGTSGPSNWVRTLTQDCLESSADDSAPRDRQLADAIAEINANRPMFTQVPGHYRVCVGYKPLPGPHAPPGPGGVSIPGGTSRGFPAGVPYLLYIHDPWPWNADPCSGGAVYWESWFSSPIMWFSFLRHRTTPCK
jgi:hypothetical protein